MTDKDLQVLKAQVERLTVEVLALRAITMLWRADHDVELHTVMDTLATTLPKTEFERLRLALEISARAIIDWSDELVGPERDEPLN